MMQSYFLLPFLIHSSVGLGHDVGINLYIYQHPFLPAKARLPNSAEIQHLPPIKTFA